MPEWLLYVIVGVLSVITCELTKYTLNRIRNTYRWKCPRCNFSIKTKNRETYEISVSSHNHSRLEEFRPR